MFRRTYRLTINKDHMPTLKAVMDIANVKDWNVPEVHGTDTGVLYFVELKANKNEINTVIEKLNRYGVKAEMAA